MSAIIQATSVSRFYGMILGLNDVTFAIRPGITGIVGPNGAGKTTLFRLITGQIRPSSGQIDVFGESPWSNPRVQARLAYCPESEVVPAGINSLEWLIALGMISGRSARDAQAQARAGLARVKLAPEHWKKRLTALSKGMKQRVKLAQCLLHEPALVILDEPMNGLDPMGREEFAGVLRQLARDGTSIIISSHILHDLEALCGEFLLLRWGRIPRSQQDAASPDARRRRPDATTFRCESPARLARYFFEHELLRGCEIVPESGLLHVKWTDAERFYGNFHEHLLASGVRIFEVRQTASFLEKAIAPPPLDS
ncbi:MAG TPA: ABC transporter ATP-binding protein [Opitutaceae bacterium]|nr:ABC transporter ATP-binding protein [Opitutaceae bacterium]